MTTPKLFRLDRQGTQIFISDLQTETESTFACVDFHPTNKRKMFDEIVDKCSQVRESVADDKALKSEIEMQLARILGEYTGEQELKEREKSSAAAKGSSKQVVERRVPYARVGGKAYEAIHVDGKPAFLCYDGSAFSAVPQITTGEDDKTIEVLLPVSDIPYEPYNFSRDEIERLASIEEEPSSSYGVTTMIKLDKTYEAIYTTIAPYQDCEQWNLQVDSAGILLSYFQDRVQSVPYIAKIGASESGKTRSLELVNALAYRPMMAVDMTAANSYRYYGQDVQGAGTIIHDEIDDARIDHDADLRAIYNAGYKLGAKVPRITGEHQEKQSYYNCYGIKWFGGVELPYSKTFRSRCIVQHFMQGIPQRIDIEEPDRQLFRMIRKELLVLRLLKAFDPLEPVKDTGLTGRSRELYTPLLTVVAGTKWYGRLLQPLLRLDFERHEEDRQSKQAHVARAVIGCWLDAAAKELGKEVKGPEDSQLDAITEAIFVSNDAAAANMGLSEIVNDKGRKILVNDDLPFTLNRMEIGRIQSENLKGKTTTKKIDRERVVRGHLFTLKTIRALYRRYQVTLDSAVTLGNTSNTSTGRVGSSLDEIIGDRSDENEKNRDDNDDNLVNSTREEDVDRPTPPPASVTSVTSVTTDNAESKQSARCHICRYELPADELQDHLGRIHSLFGLD